jgi:hypothetical protein
MTAPGLFTCDLEALIRMRILYGKPRDRSARLHPPQRSEDNRYSETHQPPDPTGPKTGEPVQGRLFRRRRSATVIRRSFCLHRVVQKTNPVKSTHGIEKQEGAKDPQ